MPGKKDIIVLRVFGMIFFVPAQTHCRVEFI